ncbi:hypothetical protein Rhal01_00480 [Rubritalea halochordaticola]|uniref:Phytanoyl-CoA dioxygenase n=1 Tax=Rubritalea halochordaticola TaxID=714537 RepID=A0ABP9UX95_9BACT
MLGSYQECGFAIIKGFADVDEVQKFRTEMDKVSESEASTCVRHLRSKSDIVEEFAFSDQVRDLLGANWLPVRSILFDKNKAMNWPVAWHQDLTIALKGYEEVSGYGPWSEKDGVTHVHAPDQVLQNMITIRLHLDDTPASNGALRVMPGSHLKGKINTALIPAMVNSGEHVCECLAGDLLVMSPLILHASHKSQKPSRRRIIHIEYAQANTLDAALEWHESAIKRK